MFYSSILSPHLGNNIFQSYFHSSAAQSNKDLLQNLLFSFLYTKQPAYLIQTYLHLLPKQALIHIKPHHQPLFLHRYQKIEFFLAK